MRVRIAQLSNNEPIYLPKQTTKARQTQADFITALLTLLTERPFSSLRVIDVVNKAGYARRTFYHYFQSLEDVLTTYLNQLTCSLFSQLAQKNHQQFTEIVFYFFNFWQQHRQVLLLLQKNQLLHLLERAWLDNLQHSALASLPTKNASYLQNFAIGGTFAMLINWLNHGATKSPTEMVQIALDIKQHLT